VVLLESVWLVRVRVMNLISLVFRSAAFRIGIACFLVLIVGGLGMYHELEMIESSVIKSQMSEVRSNSERTVVHLEQDFYRHRGRDLSHVLGESMWLREIWERTKDREPIRAFRAVIDTRNKIIAHSDPNKVGQTALPSVDEQPSPMQSFPRVIFRTDPALAGDKSFIEIRVPIRKYRSVAGYYVAGIASDWIAGKIHSEQRGAIITWMIVVGCAVLIVAITGVVLYRLASRATSLEKDLDSAETRRLTELSMLLVGMAHEIRNPLNCIRLNLHTSGKVFLGEAQFDRNEVLSMLTESVREVERVNEIISQLLGLARQDKSENEYSNAAEEIDGAIQFFRATFEQMKIGVQFHNRATNAWVAIDRARLRQILVNLMANARDALPQGGRIEIQLEADGNSASLSIADSGSGVDESLRHEIFEPFVTTRENGTGLGLSVVRSMVEQIGGAISCEKSSKLGGAVFLLRMPQCSPNIPSAG
jgi:two-component system, NtrC family, sensor histidine kinase HydH